MNAALVGAGCLAICLILAIWVVPVVGYNTEERFAPQQPIPFSHKHHVEGLGLQCQYCHTTVEESNYARLTEAIGNPWPTRRRGDRSELQLERVATRQPNRKGTQHLLARTLDQLRAAGIPRADGAQMDGRGEPKLEKSVGAASEGQKACSKHSDQISL